MSTGRLWDYTGKENYSVPKNPVLMPLSEPQIPHKLAGGGAKTSAETVGQQNA